MTRVNLKLLLSTLLILGFRTSHGRTENIISLVPRTFIEVEVQPNEDYAISATDLNKADAFAIVQANAFNGKVTLAYNRTLSRGDYTTGTNIGLVLYPDDDDVTRWGDDTVVYLRNPNNEPIHVLLNLHPYDSNAPIPGGCNMEQSIREAPFLPTRSSFWILSVEYPLGSWPRDVKSRRCEGSPLQYDIYHFYLPEVGTDRDTLFENIRKMSSVKDIEAHGTKVVNPGHPKCSVGFANYIGTGRIVAVIARGLTSSAAYVPTVSHGCISPSDGETCSLFNSVLGKLCGALLIFIGVFFAFFGHRCFKCQVFLVGFCVAGMVAFVLLYLMSNPSESPNVTLPVVGAGIVGGLALLVIWAVFGVPILPVFLGSLILGILFASIVTYTPLADLTILRDNLTFWLAFACVVLVVPLLLISYPVLASIVATGLIGAYLVVFGLDEYCGSNLKFIILNFMRRATDSSFSSAIIDPPFQSADVALTVVWGLVAFCGIAFQIYQEKRATRAPFPPPPSWPAWLSYQTLIGKLRRPNTGNEETTEATPLLA